MERIEAFAEDAMGRTSLMMDLRLLAKDIA
jgi:hypothetical protein